jgi:hypothetical protein
LEAYATYLSKGAELPGGLKIRFCEEYEMLVPHGKLREIAS